MRRRSGVTLVEVLVAIFIMGIGMIALLTLFPIGVLRMQQAINDELAAQSAVNAHSISLIYNLRNDPLVISDGVTPDFFVNPNTATLKDADPFGESYALLVDPIGTGTGTPSPWVGGPLYAGILRRRPTLFANPVGNPATTTATYSTFTLWDDMAFQNDLTLGLPGTPEIAGTAVMRSSRFSWAYTLRRPVASDRSVVECSIVVFNTRSLSLNANLNLGENIYTPTGGVTGAYFNPASNTISVYYNALAGPVAPLVRPGNWILDATQFLTKNSAGVVSGGQHAYWYRVLSTQDITDGLGNTFTTFEVQGPIRGFNNFSTWVTAAAGNPSATPVPDPNGGQAYPGTIIILDGVAEVFEKGPGRQP